MQGLTLTGVACRFRKNLHPRHLNLQLMLVGVLGIWGCLVRLVRVVRGSRAKSLLIMSRIFRREGEGGEKGRQRAQKVGSWGTPKHNYDVDSNS